MGQTKPQPGSNGARLSRQELRHRLRVWIPSDKAAINDAMTRVLDLARRCRFPEELEADLEIAVREALANAIQHGNANRAQAKIFLRCYGGPAGIYIAVRDQGAGFDPDTVPDPRDAERMYLEHGRGLLLMRELMDRMDHRRGGREVLLFRGVAPPDGA